MGKRVALVPHFTTAQLGARYKATADAATARRWQLIWLISRGATRDEAASTVGISSRWASTLIARYNAAGDTGLGDGRRGNPGHRPVLDAAQAAALAVALAAPPADGGLWTGRKVAAWMATHAGVATNPQRGVVYLRRLGRTPQVPRSCHVHAATAGEQAAFRKA
ncbi:MAG: winged helix-turn-helix domain-containing protein [Chloroflexota bacterium]|nr:winged helix-turn-helix domain-containing protein [Chloroflexota bacterium]